jgi:hypothetical protein
MTATAPVTEPSTIDSMSDQEAFRLLADLTATSRTRLGLGPDGRAPPAPPNQRTPATAPASKIDLSLAVGSLGAVAPEVDDPEEHEPEMLDPVRLPGWSRAQRAFALRGAHVCRGGPLVRGKPSWACSVPLPGPGLCVECFKRIRAAERAEAIDALVRERMPQKHWDCSWETLPTLRDEEDDGPRVDVSVETLAEIRAALDSRRRAILHGPPGAGKSTLAACYLRAAIEAGARAYFVMAVLLDDTEEGRALFDRCLHADTLVLDDLSGEFLGAPPEGSVGAIRAKLTLKLLTLRFAHSRRTVVTSGRSLEELAPLYGGGPLRRIFQGAAEIEVGGSAGDE